MKDNHKKEKRK